MKKTLVLMGTHPKGRETFNWKRKDCDIWLFNEAANLKKEDGTLTYPKVDAVIQLHDEAIWKSPKNRSDENHYNWLKENKSIPVYMQRKYPEVPMSIKYPIDDIFSMIKNIKTVIRGKEEKFNYFSSSPDYAMAMVAKMWKEGKKYERVEIWGIELQMESEYQYQRTGYGFWVGYLAALGITVVNYNSIFDAPMYGYEGDLSIPSTEIEKRIEDLQKELGEDKGNYTNEANEFLNKKLIELAKTDIGQFIQKELNSITKRGEKAGIINGKIKESKRYLEKAIEMERVSGNSVFSIGEFDGSKLSYSKQLTQVTTEMTDLDKQTLPLLNKILILKKNSQKRKRAVNILGTILAELMNKNMIAAHVKGAIEENQFYIDSSKLSIKLSRNKK